MLLERRNCCSAYKLEHPSVVGLVTVRRPNLQSCRAAVLPVVSATAPQQEAQTPTPATAAAAQPTAVEAQPAAPSRVQQLQEQQRHNIIDGIYTCNIPKVFTPLKGATFLTDVLTNSPLGTVLRLRAAGPVAIIKTLQCIAIASTSIQRNTNGQQHVTFQPQRAVLPTDHAGRWTVDLDKGRFNTMDFYVNASAVAHLEAAGSGSGGGSGSSGSKRGTTSNPFFIGKKQHVEDIKDSIMRRLEHQSRVTYATAGADNVSNLITAVTWARQELLAAAAANGGGAQFAADNLHCEVTYTRQPFDAKQQHQQQGNGAAKTLPADHSSSSSSGSQQEAPHVPMITAFQVTLVRCRNDNISSMHQEHNI